MWPRIILASTRRELPTVSPIPIVFGDDYLFPRQGFQGLRDRIFRCGVYNPVLPVDGSGRSGSGKEDSCS